VFEIQQPDLPP